MLTSCLKWSSREFRAGGPLASGPALTLLAALLVAGCATAIEPVDKKAQARCFALGALYNRYTSNTPFGTGLHLGHDIAVEQCRRGDTESGLRSLEDLIKRQRLEGAAARI